MYRAHVIFSGVDRCGKSSLVEKFRAVHQPAYFKMRVPTTFKESNQYYHEHMDWLMRADTPSVWDRGLLDELVYGPLYRPQECLPWYQQNLIDWTRLPTKLPVIQVYVYPLFDELLLADDRPGADRNAELNQFNQMVDRISWPKIFMTKHTIRDNQPAWKNRDESWDELSKYLECFI